MSKQLDKKYIRYVQIQVQVTPEAYTKLTEAIEHLKSEGSNISYAGFCREASIREANKIIKKAKSEHKKII